MRRYNTDQCETEVTGGHHPCFKSAVTKRINQMRGSPGVSVWQRNYWEHIIRDERALQAIRRYIINNPLRWHLDRYNPHSVKEDPWAEEIWHLIRNTSPPWDSSGQLEVDQKR